MKLLKILLALTLLTTLSCSTDDASNDDASVTITASGLGDDKLALNNAATFTADVTGYDGDPSDLTYRWTLSTERGELSDGTNPLPNPTVGGNSIRCVGKTAGDEKIIVEVLDATNSHLATASMDFTIVPPTDHPVAISRGCFDQPKIIYQKVVSYYVCNFDGSGEEYIGIFGGLSVDISPDGEWLAYNPYEGYDNPPVGYSMYVLRCDGTDRVRIHPDDYVSFEEYSDDGNPHFSPDSKTLYFLRPHPDSEPAVLNALGPYELVAYELESGERRFLTSFYLQKESVKDFTVSHVTGEIAFIRQTYDNDATEYVITLAILQPETGFTQDLTTLPSAQWSGMDWSSDGEDIIYAASASTGEQGIFRINLTSGSQPLLLYNNTAVGYPHYYADDTRIVMHGQLNGTTSLNLWTIDANGNDLQQLTDVPQTIFMQNVLH